MSISLIIQVILAIPKILGLIRDLVSLLGQKQSEKNRDAISDSLLKESQAKTKEEMWKENENITSRLP